MSQLNFSILPSKNCGRVLYTPCNTLCTTDTYTNAYLISGFTYSHLSGVKYTFTANPQMTGTVASYSWSFTSSTGTTSSASSSAAVFSLTVGGTPGYNTVALTIVDTNGLTSTVTGRFVITGGTGSEIVWAVIPNISVNVSNSPLIHFSDASTLVTSTINSDDSLSIGDSTTLTTLPNVHTYPDATATYTLNYSFTESEEDVSCTLTAALRIVATDEDCTDELTLSNISTVELFVETPSGVEIDALDIETEFLTNADFYLDAEDFEDLTDFSESGIWKFTVVVTKVSGSTYIFNQCKEVIIICDLECRWASMLSDLAIISPECQDCQEVKVEQALEAGLYMDALKNSIACNDRTQIANLINILEILLSNTDCNCS